MSHSYIEYQFTVSPAKPGVEILMAQLAAMGFESFIEEDTGLLAYIVKDAHDPEQLQNLQVLSNSEFTIHCRYKEIAEQNWNAMWESNFDPIIVDHRCAVRAPFHPKQNLPFDILIEPKMSFGTGHHETTHMMLQFVLDLEIQHKKVLDMGSGTGVLAILASLRGAFQIDAIDIDHWCYLNAIENAERNNCTNIQVHEGDVSLIGEKYDVILANINRNVLLKDIPFYAKALTTNGILILSGFYTEDLPMIQTQCEKFQLSYVSNLERKNWVAVKFQTPS